jgi:hypothetical protein
MLWSEGERVKAGVAVELTAAETVCRLNQVLGRAGAVRTSAETRVLNRVLRIWYEKGRR